jgi:hypothetical protein
MESHAAIHGLSFAFHFCNLFARGYKGDPFVLRPQPLDTSPLGLCWPNKMLLPANLPQCPVSQLIISCNSSSTQVEEVRHLDNLPCLPPTGPVSTFQRRPSAPALHPFNSAASWPAVATCREPTKARNTRVSCCGPQDVRQGELGSVSSGLPNCPPTHHRCRKSHHEWATPECHNQAQSGR